MAFGGLRATNSGRRHIVAQGPQIRCAAAFPTPNSLGGLNLKFLGFPNSLCNNSYTKVVAPIRLIPGVGVPLPSSRLHNETTEEDAVVPVLVGFLFLRVLVSFLFGLFVSF